VAFKQYTECEQAAVHNDQSQYIQAFIYAGPFAAVALTLSMLVNPLCALFAAEVSALLWLLAYCDWWLRHRLICLDGDRAAVGMVVSNEPPGEKTFPNSLDTDFSTNLLLPPNEPGTDQATAETRTPFGELIKDNDLTKNRGLPAAKYEATDTGSGVKSAVLHVEFEGGGIYIVMVATMVALPMAIAALTVCLAAGPVGAAVAGFLALLALLALLIGGLLGLGDEGTPEDVGLPSIETNDTAGLGADVLGVVGRWVYDSGHNNEGTGWNELHPAKVAEKLGTWTGDWGAVDVGGTPTDVDVIIAEWGEKAGEALDPTTTEAQEDPENIWDFHPDVDGCDPEGSHEPIEPPH
jgi:hypothetical protein